MANKSIKTGSSLSSAKSVAVGNASAAIPNTPTIGTATATSDVAATVTYTAAVLGATASTFTATSSPGSITGTGSSPITVTGLTASTSYTFTVTAGNANGTSSPSSASNSITTSAPLTSYFSIATTTVGSGGSSSITFGSGGTIPQTYKHLQIRAISRTNRADTNDFITVRFNSDSGSNYAYHSLYGDGSSARADDTGTSTGTPWSGATAGANAGASMFGAVVWDILDYTNTNKYKTLRLLSGTDQNSIQGRVYFQSNLWLSTSAITSITIIPTYGTSFSQYSHFALYGIKGA